jgi:hypothetical protein
MESTYEDDELLDELPAFEPEPDEARPERGSDPRLELAVKMLRQVHDTLGHALELLKGEDAAGAQQKLADLLTTKNRLSRHAEVVSGGRNVEGVFDGAMMVGADGKRYAVPPNYASKSRLVEGDVLKLSIRSDGTFIFKQIGPIERRRVVGCLGLDTESGGHVALCGEFTYRLLPASVSYFRGEPGDEVVCLVPKSGKTAWAAVENILKK